MFDNDEIKQLIPEFKASYGGAANSVHNESKKIQQSAFSKFLSGGERNGYNLVIPIIGDSEKDIQDKWIQKLEDAGYDVKIKYQDADTKVSMNRVMKRAIETGRIIPSEVIFEYGNRPKKVFEYFKNKKNKKGVPYVR